MDAIAHIIEEKGVSSVTIKEVSKVSKTDVIVLERRYKTDEGLVRASVLGVGDPGQGP